MTEEEYEKLLAECAQKGGQFEGYRVNSFISLPSNDLHVFTIFTDDDLLVAGLPLPRTFFSKNIERHTSRLVEWDMWIAEQELYWKPINNEKLIMPGRFRRVRGGQIEEEWEEGDTVEELVMKMKPPTSRPRPLIQNKIGDLEMGS